MRVVTKVIGRPAGRAGSRGISKFQAVMERAKFFPEAGLVRHLEWVGLLGVLAAALCVYRRSFDGFFVQDDFGWLESSRFCDLGEYLPIFFRFNPALSYRPLSQETFFWIGQKIFGMWPPGFHLVSVACHLLATTLLYLLLRRFFPVAASLTAALFFAVHNAHFSSLFWISALPEPLAMVFYLAALLLFLRFDSRGSRGSYICSVFAMCLGVMSKESVLTLPIVLAAYCLFLAPHRLVYTAPHFLISGVYVYFRATSSSVGASPYPLGFGLEAWRNFESYLSWTAGFSETILKVKLLWDPAAAYPWIAAVSAISLLLLVVFSRNRRAALFALAWYFIALQPVLYFSDHIFPYYLAPSLAAVGLLLASWLPPSRGLEHWKSWVASMSLLGIFVWLSYTSVRLEGRWWNERTLEGKQILSQMPEVDRQVPQGRIAYIMGFGTDELGILQNDSAFKAYGFSPGRFIQVGINPRTIEEIRILEKLGGLGDYYCFLYESGKFLNVTEAFRRDPEMYIGDDGYLDRPEVRLEARAAEIVAGEGTLELRVVNLEAPAIDLLYTLDGKRMNPIFDWSLDEHGGLSIFVDKNTRRGLYHIRAIRDSSGRGGWNWIRVDAKVLIK